MPVRLCHPSPNLSLTALALEPCDWTEPRVVPAWGFLCHHVFFWGESQPKSFALRYIIAAIDATVWPKNDNMQEALQVLHTICSMGTTNLGYIQLPLSHSQTSLTAIVKHKRRIEDHLLKTECDFSNSLTLVYSREGLRSDAWRPASQHCMVVTVGKGTKWSESQAYQTGMLGPLPLSPVRDFIGFDPDNRPGAGARVEQSPA